MASTDASTSDRCTVYARPFPKSTTEERVRELFLNFGRVRHVRLRREAATNSFRGSVVIEFEEEAAALASVRDPPLQVNSSSRLQVLFKADYEQLRHASSSGQSQHGQPPKRAKHGHASGGHPNGGTPVSTTTTQPPQPPQDDAGRDARIAVLEAQLRKEQEAAQQLQQRLAEAQQRADEAASREAATSQKLLVKDVEIGSLKGEIGALRTQGNAAAERVQAQYKARVGELEAQMQKLKDRLLEKERDSRLRLAGASRTPTPLAGEADDGL